MGQSVKHLLHNPHKVDISLLIPSIDFDSFKVLYDSLIDQCSAPSRVEMLLKLDNIQEMEKYYQLCESSEFKYKILIYPQFNGRCSLHYFFNDLGAIASGKIIWILNDDASVSGQWYDVLMKTRGVFDDNVYCVIIPLDNGKGSKQITPLPALSKEWVHKFDQVTRFPNFDRWIDEISRGVDRRIIVKEKDLIISMPQGRRVLSKQDRKDVFYPAVKKYIRKYKRRLKI